MARATSIREDTGVDVFQFDAVPEVVAKRDQVAVEGEDRIWIPCLLRHPASRDLD